MLTMSTAFCDHLFVTSPTDPAKSRKYHHGNLREALIEAGLVLIAEKGVRALTLREIGARAGVSRMAAYRHFKNKEDLLLAISEAGFVRFGDKLENARRTAPANFADRITAMGLAYVEFASEHRAHYEVMFLSLDDAGERLANGGEAGLRAFAILAETVRDGQAAGDVLAGDSAAIASLVWSSIHGISMLRLASANSANALGPDFVRFSAQVLSKGLKPV
jgi:AcrR family transcriptional regulator